MKIWIFITSCLLFINYSFAQTRQAGEYPFTQDSLVQQDTRKGKLQGPFEFHSKIFAGTVRQYWIYIPADYNPKQPPNLLVFQDGQRATNPNGSLRIPVVLDNLIHKKEIPSTLGIFITPGNLSEHYPDNLGMSNPNHRAEEYDALNDNYARLLTEELLPEVSKHYVFTQDPQKRIIGGTSSGAICAWTVAWHNPDAFRNVISLIGSYTSIGFKSATASSPLIPGGDLYPGLIRKSPIRPIKIFLQDGSNDLSNEHGNWFLANQQMLSSLEWANANADAAKSKGPRYQFTHVWGDGGHSDQHGGALMPDILRWFWQSNK